MTPDRLGCRDPSLRLRAPLRVTNPERMGDRSHLDAHASAAQRQHENRFSVLGSRFYSHIGQPILTGRYGYMTTTEVQAQQRRRHAAIATLQASAPPLALTRGDWMRSLLVFVAAVLALLLPPNPPNELAVGIHSPTFRVPGDARRLGIKIEGFSVVLARDSLPFPTMPQFLSQIALILAAQLTAVRLGWRRRALALLGLALALALATLLSVALLLTYSYLPRLAVAGGALAALTWLGL